MKAIIFLGLGGSGGFRNGVRIWRNGLHTLTKNSKEYSPPTVGYSHFLKKLKILPALMRIIKEYLKAVNTISFLLTGDLAQAIRKNTNITFGLYHSLFEWFNPIYLKDQANNYMTQDYVKVSAIICILFSSTD